MSEKPEQPFSLGSLIQYTASELEKVRKTEGAVMQFEKCDLELAVTVSAGATAGIQFWLVGAKTDVKGEAISRLKLSFGPIAGDVPTFNTVVKDPKGVDPENFADNK